MIGSHLKKPGMAVLGLGQEMDEINLEHLITEKSQAVVKDHGGRVR